MTRISPDWLNDPAVRAVIDALHPANPHFVGGCVRDALMDRQGGDIDIAVAVPPDQAMALAEAAGLGVHPTGVDHGVVTVSKDGHAFEIASLRRDMATDGRRAVVAFTTSMADDAARRDFTMNALYAAPDGKVIDPLGEGIDDALTPRIRFIGDASARIAEDYLRILRFFRFHAVFAINSFDPAALAACHQGVAGLSRISAERIGDEMLKLLAAPDPVPALTAMGEILKHVLPGAVLPEGLVDAERDLGVEPDALRRLAALAAVPDVAAVHLRLSRKAQKYLAAMAEALADDTAIAQAAWRWGDEVARDVAVLRAAAGRAAPLAWRAEIARGLAAIMPVQADDLMRRGMVPGPPLGAVLRRIEADWLASDFALDRAALLSRHASPQRGED
ncbi:MAG: CCA tRNA nucleotidyltransferase [Pseudomonadota bacterium]